MSRVMIATALIAVLLGGWLLAQQPGAPKPPAPPDGRYTVSGSGDGVVLLETTTGKTWVLRRGPTGGTVWVPIRRIDSEEEAQKLLVEEMERERERQQLELKLKFSR